MIPAAASADDEPPYLLGDWNGTRTALEDGGVSFEAILTTDLISNVSGGLKRQTVVEGNVDLTATLDTSKAGLWDGGTAFVYVLGNFGEAATEIVGDLQASSNIEAPEAIKLYEAWYNHDFLDGSFSLLFGLHDYNSEFNTLEYASVPRSSSFGIEPDISQVGPSIFPTTSLALRARVRPTSTSYLQAAVYDGVPGNPNNSRGTHIILRTKDGMFFGFEGGVTAEEESDSAKYYKAAVGGWHQTTDFEDFRGDARTQNGGVYAIGERSLISVDGEHTAIGGFIQAGLAQGDRNEIGQYFGTGISAFGPIPSRPDDVATFGVAVARLTSGAAEDRDRAETALELSYRVKLTESAAIQPDIQYIVNPGANPSLDDALVLSVRFELSL